MGVCGSLRSLRRRAQHLKATASTCEAKHDPLDNLSVSHKL